MQESQFWKLYKEDQPSCPIAARTSAGLVYILDCLLESCIPSFPIELPLTYRTCIPVTVLAAFNWSCLGDSIFLCLQGHQTAQSACRAYITL